MGKSRLLLWYVMKRGVFAFLLCTLFGADLVAQDCWVRPQTDRNQLWKEDTAVNIWVDPDFGYRASYFPQVVTNWGSSSAASMMGVTLNITSDRSIANVEVLRDEVPGHPNMLGGIVTQSMAGIGVYRATVYIHPDMENSIAAGLAFAHHLGHPFGLVDCDACHMSSVMGVQTWTGDIEAGRLGPTACDLQAIEAQWKATFDPDPCQDYCNSGIGGGDGCYCSGGPLKCSTCTPVILDLDGDGVDLSAAADGVEFAMNPGAPGKLAWTLAGDDDGWLSLDRDCSGTIDDGSELFGNYTEQPATGNENGYAALAMFDRPEAGGNGDNRIDATDPVYRRLTIWIDRNHDGRSTGDEVVPLSAAGIESIDLAYRSSGQRDKYGNQFRYRAKVTRDGRERWSYDVFLATEP